MTSALTGKAPRLLSLDFFRGFTMAAMILVNDPGNDHAYPPLEHADWNGCTPTDLIFPSFLFMIGVAIVYAMQSKKESGNHGKLIWHAFRRMVILILISWAISFAYNHHLSTLRIPGVLQRLAVSYFIGTILYLKTSDKTRYWIFALILIGYWAIMTFIPVPDGHPANLEKETNLGAWLDRLVFGTNHLWKHSKTWDPEGLLGVITSVGTCLFGISVGQWIKRTDVEPGTKTAWLFFYGVLAIILGLIWNLFFPINKQLWTSSYVLYAGGISTLGLSLSYWFIDVQGRNKWVWPFVVFGVNSIVAYILSDFVAELINLIKVGYHGEKVGLLSYIYRSLMEPHLSAPNASLAYSLLFVFIIWLILLPLYRKKIYIKV